MSESSGPRDPERPAARAVATREGEHAGGFFLLGALLGAAIGAALGLLYAPRPGTATREELARRSEEVRQRAQRLGAQVGAITEDLRERAETVRAADESQPGAAEPSEAPDRDLPPGEDLA